MIGLILIDIDGTLLGKHGIHASTPPALQRARDAGIHLGLCTGRIGSPTTLEFARLVAPQDLHVFHSGAVISDANGQAAHLETLPRATYQKLVELSRTQAQPLEVYTQNALFLERHSQRTRIHEEHLGMNATLTDLLALQADIVRVQWVVHESVWPQLRELTAQLPELEISPATAPWSPGTVFASVTKRGSSKAHALAWLAQHYGLEINQTAMVGDGENDLDAIQAAGLGIAMGNAPAHVQASAQLVVADVDEGGLAAAIEACMENKMNK